MNERHRQPTLECQLSHGSELIGLVGVGDHERTEAHRNQTIEKLARCRGAERRGHDQIHGVER